VTFIMAVVPFAFDDAADGIRGRTKDELLDKSALNPSDPIK
jgi:hypothetical protein